MNSAVSAYAETVENLAQQFVGWNGAESEDLTQEGLLFVWQSLERGISPAASMIENRMRDYADLLGRQEPIPYEAMLPLDDFRSDREET